jgi:hypothetical protein
MMSTRIRLRAARTKALLKTLHANGPDGYLSARQTPLPAGAQSREWEPPLPVAVRRSALRANHHVRGFQSSRRAHRPTGRPQGPHIDDTCIAREVLWYQREYQMEELEARRLLAAAIADAEGIELKSALARVRRALQAFK